MTLSEGRSIYDGFEGYRDPTEQEVLDLLASCPVILDTNVLLDIYGFAEPARVLALDVLESIRDRLWVPHQVMREFWRNRHEVIAAIPVPVQPIDAVQTELMTIVNSLRPDSERPEEIQAIRATVQTQLRDLADAINKARGVPLNIDQILLDTSLDPVLSRLEVILSQKVGAPFEDDEAKHVENGLKRFASKIPPGYKDGEGKASQVPEQGTGDYLIWEQSLAYVSALQEPVAFVFVTNDAKEDWRINLLKPKKRTLGVRPELVAEALERTKCPMVLLQQNDFYRLMSRLRPGDEAASESLVEASAINLKNSSEYPGESWTALAFQRLLHELRESGYEVQADIISLAAKAGGFISRAQIYEYAGYSEDRSLRRFALPAQRIALGLAEQGVVPEDAPAPLEAVYEGPGRTIGYQVPDEFCSFAEQQAEQLTWVAAAARVATSEPERVWSVTELVAEIGQRGLRDLSAAKTPEATLRRDLALRGGSQFERIGSGFRIMKDATEDV